MIPKPLPEKIIGERLTLRRLQPKDAEAFYAFVREDDNVKYMFFTDEQRTKDGAQGMVEWVINAYDTDDPVCIFAMAHPETDEYMGNLGAQTMDGTSDTEFFYLMLPQFRGQGYVTEAVKMLLTFLFEGGITLAVAIILPENDASIRIVNRLNARYVGEVLIHGEVGLRYEVDRKIFEAWL